MDIGNSGPVLNVIVVSVLSTALWGCGTACEGPSCENSLSFRLVGDSVEDGEWRFEWVTQDYVDVCRLTFPKERGIYECYDDAAESHQLEYEVTPRHNESTGVLTMYFDDADRVSNSVTMRVFKNDEKVFENSYNPEYRTVASGGTSCEKTCKQSTVNISTSSF